MSNEQPTLYLIALKERLLSNTVVLESGCWYCSLGGENSRYGSIYFNGVNINNHVASYMAHKGTITTGKMICHTCDNKRCINPEHLFEGTGSDNQQDAKRKGRRDSRVGTLNPRAVLTEETVREIKYFLKHSGSTQKQIADHFGISQNLVCNINTGKRWSHVD